MEAEVPAETGPYRGEEETESESAGPTPRTLTDGDARGLGINGDGARDKGIEVEAARAESKGEGVTAILACEMASVRGEQEGDECVVKFAVGMCVSECACASACWW